MVTGIAEASGIARGIRRFDVSRDLDQLADLMEVAFGQELEATENLIVQELRRMARMGAALWLLAKVAPMMHGFVYVDGELLVGNVTLSEDREVPRQWIMSNVAVRPTYRSKGIATALVRRSLQWVRSRGARRIRLQVRTDNVAAQTLYDGLGFRRYDTVAELSGRDLTAASPTGVGRMTELKPDDWRATYELALAAIPDEVRRVQPVRANEYQRTRRKYLMDRVLERVRDGRETHCLGLFVGDELAVYLRVYAKLRPGQHRITSLIHPDVRGKYEDVLVKTALGLLSTYPARQVFTSVSVRDPALIEALKEAGFRTLRLLDQLVLVLDRPAECPGR
jgi:ribosomal protein S18 acetylase RimI-like enzyme